jgi:hypothetical protein
MKYIKEQEDDLIAILRWRCKKPSTFKYRWQTLKKIGQFINRSQNYVRTRLIDLEDKIKMQRGKFSKSVRRKALDKQIGVRRQR